MGRPKKTSAKKTGKRKAKNKASKSAKGQKSSLFWWGIKWCLILGIWGFLVVGAVVAYYCHDLPDIAKAASFDRKRSVTFYADDGKTVIARYGEMLGENLTYEDLPPHLVEAVLATEDRRFFYHFGVDPIGIVRAMITNMQENRIAQGGSTITQQLAKNLFLSSERTIERKIQEAVLAIWLESSYTKEEILAAYLNRVYMGAGAYGVDAATQIYFKKPVSQLTREESAMLAGLLKAPSRYNPISNKKKSIERSQVVLSLMDDFESPFEQQQSKQSSNGKTAMIVPPSKPFNISYTFDEARYFTDWVIEQIPSYVNSPEQDLEVYTTLNLDLQKSAYTAAKKHTEEWAKRQKGDKEAPEFSAILTYKNGAIKTLLGGSNYTRSQFNRATQAMRQPGSSFKPFVYLAALQAGWDMNDYISDEPFEKNGYRPENYKGEFHGEVPLWEALMHSYNVASVRLLDEVTLRPVIETARALGITTDIQPDLSIALGSSETTLLNMVQAYHNIAHYERQDVPLYGITKIKLPDGQVLYERKAVQNSGKNMTLHEFFNRDRNESAMQQLTAMMQGVVIHGTGRRANLGFPIAGKTGTSQNNRDAWFLGFSSEYTAGVWVGYDDNKPMHKVYGGTIPAAIWADMVAEAHKDIIAAPLLKRSYNFEYKSSFFGGFSRNNRSHQRLDRITPSAVGTSSDNNGRYDWNDSYNSDNEGRRRNNRDGL